MKYQLIHLQQNFLSKKVPEFVRNLLLIIKVLDLISFPANFKHSDTRLIQVAETYAEFETRNTYKTEVLNFPITSA